MEGSMTAAKGVAKGVSILLVEDDDGDAKAMERAFRRAKIANPLHRAIDGYDALDLLRGEHGKQKLPQPYLLLVDLNMPRMNGIQLLEELRRDPVLKRTIAFVLTTSKREEDKLAAYNLNIAGYILKQTADEDLLRLVELIDCYWRIVEMP
jgi:CheY-like chemotaxis protein